MNTSKIIELLYHNPNDMSTNNKIGMRLLTAKWIFFLSAIIGITHSANAQLTEFEAMYYQNQYIANPAMAGVNKGLDVNIGYQRQWDKVPGNPVLMYATVEYNPEDRMAYGFNFNSDRAGLITNTRFLGTFAYHLPIDRDERELHFGLSFGARFLSLDTSKIIGDMTDPSIQNFNEGGALDGDFGISYTSRLLTIQAAVPNLNNVFFENDNGERRYVDNQVFYSAVSYKVFVASQMNDFNLEPLVAYRAIRGYKDIVDTGIRFNMPEYKMNIAAIYHTNKTISGTFGLDLNQFGIFLAYSFFASNSGAYANDTLEFGLRYRFLD
ncbi:MAG: PorP/SprF family type IX secretion system membrane protein [Flavobacterium nitrogenifigens]|uniref:PorP/SprF family type IX secretion system membrane protein n=1 Tax=Flavobacterium nitrogenifigens TaxID=1617283 RepID=UPI0028076EAB|nr:PorP/SprF family type IX secretion system membrane protein [Flavobacterium nitrogenifigens]MDQ8014966.1 PorP/SprF family type IX secretion system membrane protein [Flavobacterium nitrogenifigens]